MNRRAVAAAAIVVAAFTLYAPTINDYFVQDDFGVVSLFSQRSLAYFGRWFVVPWTEDIWGYVPDELRPFPAASYVIAVLARQDGTAAEPRYQRRAARIQRPARDVDCRIRRRPRSDFRRRRQG
jgi:hypothetical protein